MVESRKSKDRYNHSSNDIINDNDKEMNEMEIYEAFQALDVEYKGIITLYDLYTIYLAYDYQPNDITFLDWKHLLLNNNNESQQLIQQQQHNIESDQLKIEDVFIILSMFVYDRQNRNSFHLLLPQEQQEQHEQQVVHKEIDNSSSSLDQKQQKQYITATDLLNITQSDVTLKTIITDSIAQKMIQYVVMRSPNNNNNKKNGINKEDFDHFFSRR